MKLAALALLASAAQAPNTEFAWDCKITSSANCFKGVCRQTAVRARLYIYPSEGMYWRCKRPGLDLGDCAEYRATVGVANGRQTFDLVGAHGFASLDPDLAIIETFAVPGENTIMAGRCIVGPPPLIMTDPRPR